MPKQYSAQYIYNRLQLAQWGIDDTIREYNQNIESTGYPGTSMDKLGEILEQYKEVDRTMHMSDFKDNPEFAQKISELAAKNMEKVIKLGVYMKLRAKYE